MLEILNQIDGIIWGPFVLIPLLLGTGIWLTVRLGGVQFTKLVPALPVGVPAPRDGDDEQGDVSHFHALSTALAATVGVGNIARWPPRSISVGRSAVLDVDLRDLRDGRQVLRKPSWASASAPSTPG